VHLAEADYAGHSIGWMSFAYRWAVNQVDQAVAEVLKSADAAYGKGNYTVIVTADHGGHGRNHGEDVPTDMMIPWIVWGEGVTKGLQVADGVKTMDTAATVLWLLGVQEPELWTGHAVSTAFTPEAQELVSAKLAARAAAAAVGSE
jgi:arylsulfatase A-like enzyme